MGQRCCAFCRRPFEPSRFHPEQTACSDKLCQHQRRSHSRKQKLARDPEYRAVCRDSSRKWRNRNPDYWKQYRAKHPDAVARNREKQKARDTRQHLRDLANNTSALDLKHSAAAVWLLNGQGADLANNNSVSAQVWVIEALPRRKGPGSESCKQQPAGTFSTFAG